MIRIIDYTTKVEIESETPLFMPSLIYKSQLNRISHNQDEDIIILYFSNDRLIFSYIYIDPAQRAELNINSNADLLQYFKSIT